MLSMFFSFIFAFFLFSCWGWRRANNCLGDLPPIAWWRGGVGGQGRTCSSCRLGVEGVLEGQEEVVLWHHHVEEYVDFFLSCA
jgi:hypothetical protein